MAGVYYPAPVSWPVIVTAGGPRERGRAYGTQARERVHASLSLYEQIVDHYTGMAWAEARARAGAFAEPMDSEDPRLLPEIEGIAEGAGVDAEDVLTLNVRTELMFGMRRPGAPIPEECTAVCAGPSETSGGRVLLAQNWDWKPGARDTCVVLVAAPEGAPGFVTLVEAGLLAKCGVSESGIGVAANALESSNDRGEPGMPFHAILRRILTSATFDEAVDAVNGARRSSSANYLIASADGTAADLEAAPGGPDQVHRMEGPRLVHTNHFLRAGRSFKDLALISPGSTSVHRQTRAETRIAAIETGALTIDALRDVLRDHDGHPGSVCKHRSAGTADLDDSVTIASFGADLTGGTMWTSEGPSCEVPLDPIEVAAAVADARARAPHI